MQIKITNNEGLHRLFNGDIEFYNTYISIRYRNRDDGNELVVIIPWRIIDEVEVKP